MAAQTRPEPGTEVATVTANAVGKLPPEIQAAMQLRKAQNMVAAQIASLNWGKALDLDTRRSVAEWGRQFRVDVTTEIHVLGANVYLNAGFYLRRLGELISRGLVDYAYADHVEDDARLKLLGAEGEGEFSRRLRERIKHAIPDAAASAVVFRVKLRSMSEEITGVKWCGGNTRKSDPVGEAFPVETSESRAARRAMRLVVSHIPELSQETDEVERAAELVSQQIGSARQELKRVEASVRPVPALASPANPADPYGLDESKAVPAEAKVEAPAREPGEEGDELFGDA